MADTLIPMIAIIVGIYVGMFISEADTIYQCKKNQSITISGHIWKGEIKFACTIKEGEAKP
jgi:hypothetical protein